ncbi:MAG: VCBS repeat-containing protein [Planctomycetes bacterium]|nr:VCBS repeat-containing protein [Planctomycetota bacterium]
MDVAKFERRAREFCGDCHAPPRAESFPKAAWKREVERGFAFYLEANRHDLVAPPEEEVEAYYRALAPDRLVVDPPKNESDGRASRFHRSTTAAPQLEPPAVSFVDWLPLPHHGQKRLLFCDMRSGLVGAVNIAGDASSVETLTTLRNPSRAALADLDGDGRDELVIGELGSLASEDHSRGAVVWLQWSQERGGWRQRLLVSGLGRVADVRPGDFDGDGDADLLVAEFGHLHTGRILLLENLGLERGMPKLREHVVDDRHGTIDVPVADLNGDGRPDFVALISQEHEVVEAFLNLGDGRFRRETIFAAGDPAYGSSGIELVDLDGDGDLDVLYSNGDTFGSDYLKPYHGIRWLENQGEFPFVEVELVDMVGVQAARAADIDDDGDLDVVAAGFLPKNLVARPEVSDRGSLIWLEQKEPRRFVPHALENGKFLHAALAIDDFDDDGDQDLAVGNFQDLDGPREPWLSLWWNGR